MNRTIPNQALSGSSDREGVEIRLGGMPKENSPKKLARKVLLGTMLGDGCLTSQSPEKASFKATHANNQLEYLIWKAKILLPLTGRFLAKEVFNMSGNDSRGYKTSFASLSNKYLKHIYDDLYREVNGKKARVMRLNVLNRLTPISIAVMYGDNGTLVSQRRKGHKVSVSIRLYTNAFTHDENVLLCRWLSKRFDFNFKPYHCNRSKTWFISSDAKTVKPFLDLVRPYLSQVECMRYKLDPNLRKIPNHSARRLAQYELSDDMIRTPEKIGRPFGFKLSARAKQRESEYWTDKCSRNPHVLDHLKDFQFKKGFIPWNKNPVKSGENVGNGIPL